MISLRPDQIHTLIFMDFETTGMIPENIEKSRPTPGDKSRSISHMVTRNCNIHDTPSEMPQITEMAFVSVPRQLFASAVDEIHTEGAFDEDAPLIKKIPSNIYVSQIKPNLNYNQWKQYEETRKHCSAMHLSQIDLKYKNSFATEWPAVHAFLSNQKRPAIIIAHNGANFDFRVLYSELIRNKLLSNYPLPDGIYFLDSYLAFLDIEKQHLDNLAVTTSLINWSKVNGVVDLAKQTTITTVTEEKVEVTEDIIVAEEANLLDESMDIFLMDNNDIPQTSAASLLRPAKDGMKTPPQRRPIPSGSKSVDSGFKRRLVFDDDEDVLPLSFINKTSWSPAKKRRIQKNFFIKTSETNWEFNKIGAREYFFKGNFKLESLFKQISKSSYDAHHALDDCHALMQVSLAYGEDFLTYMESRKEKIPLFYAKKFVTSAVQPITPAAAPTVTIIEENIPDSP